MDGDPNFLAIGLAWYVIFVISTSLHEMAHALSAYRLGDPTAYYAGQVTPDPIPHIAREPMGMVFVPWISYFVGHWMIGWASAPYDPYWAQRHPRRAALMALAGPIANLSLVLVAAAAVRLGLQLEYFHAPERVSDLTNFVAAYDEGVPTSVATLLSIMLTLNLLLFVFNLIPVPPLDGSAVIGLFLPASLLSSYQQVVGQPAFRLIGIIIAWNLIGAVYGPVHHLALNLVYAGHATY